MNWTSYDIEFITPCFCAGADQTRAEVRVPSIRGQLRWWFRVLGGNRQQEKEVFGGVHGGAVASKVRLRIVDPPPGTSVSPDGWSNLGCFPSGRRQHIPTGARFKLQLTINDSVDSVFDLAWKCFCRLGAIGLRSARGWGALQEISYRPSQDEFLIWADSLRRKVGVYALPLAESADKALEILERKIKEFRDKYQIRKNEKSALGWARGRDRQASCLRVRPVALRDSKYLPVVIYTEYPLGKSGRGLESEVEEFFGHKTHDQ